MDPDVAAALAALVGEQGDVERSPRDIATRRSESTALFDAVAASWPVASGVEVHDYALTTADGAELPMWWYRPEGADRFGPGLLYLHGGGMILAWGHVGRVYDAVLREYVASSRVPVLVVDYRVAPEYPDPTPVSDCYAALQWLEEHAGELGVDPARIGVAGDSAGGGLAAGVSLMARDRGGPAIAQQLLAYPMLDDRTVVPDPQLPPDALIWTYDDNATGWGALLGDAAGGPDVSAYAAPARAADLTGLPPTYIDTGDLDIFRDEDVDFARRLALAGVPTELHVHPGCPHGFETFAQGTSASRQAIDNRVRWLRRL